MSFFWRRGFRMNTLLLFSIMFIALPRGVSAAPTDQQSAESLKGLKSIAIVVEDLSEDEKRFGLTKGLIQTDVELKLRLAGIRVVPDAELPAFAVVHVTVIASPSGFAAAVEVALMQWVSLARNPSIGSLATTWKENEVIGKPNGSEIRESVKNHVDRYVNAWLSVNPK
jgi:hypothetical protein